MENKMVRHLLEHVATRLQLLSQPDMISRRLRRRYLQALVSMREVVP